MKSILPCLTFCAWAAVAWTVGAASGSDRPTGRPTTQSRAGDQLLLQAIGQLEQHESVTARLRHQVSLGEHQLFGVGSYWQQGSGDQLRVRLELQFAGGETSLLQVSNGRFLWEDRRLPTGRVVRRLDLRRLRAEADAALAELDELQPGQATWSPTRPELADYYGGLPKLLHALADGFAFSQPQAMRLRLTPADGGEATNVPVFASVGHWKPERLARILPERHQQAVSADGQGEGAGRLPPRVPEEVLLVVGQTDMFPYRIEFRRSARQQASSHAGAGDTPYQLTSDPLVLLELSEISFDVAIGPGQFDYSPGDVEWDDRTVESLDKIRRQREEQLAERHRRQATR